MDGKRQALIVAALIVLALLVIYFVLQRPGGTRAGFTPVPMYSCGGINDPYYAVDLTGRNAAGTVVWEPFSTQSKVSLERGVSAPSLTAVPNPVSRIGTTSSVRAWGDEYTGDEARHRLTVWELHPGEPGYMEEIDEDGQTILAATTRRSPPTLKAAKTCPLATTDIDSDFATDGYYGTAVLADEFGKSLELREGLTSARRLAANKYTDALGGLGSIHQDPRFEPGSQLRIYGGDYSPAPGGHAGGLSLGALGSATFAPGNVWDSRYIFAFGDKNPVAPREYPVDRVVTLSQ